MGAMCHVVAGAVALVLILNAEPTGANYVALVGYNTTITRPPRQRSYTDFFLYRNNIEQSTGTRKFVMNASRLVIVDTTLEDAGIYEWRSQRHGYSSGRYRRTESFYLYVFDYIQPHDTRRLTASPNRTLMCEYRYNASGPYTHINGLLGDRQLEASYTNTTQNGSYYTTKTYYPVSHALGQSFRCEAGSPSKIVSENITIGVVDRLMYPGGTFEISANVSSNDRYLSLDINDIPVLAGNLHDFLIPGRSDRFKVKSQEDGNSTLVTLSVTNVTYADSGVYRWYFFGQGEFGWVNLVLAEEPRLIIPPRVTAGETVQLMCRLRYYDGNARVADDSKLLIRSFTDDGPLTPVEETWNSESDWREFTQVYELLVCADHHLQNFVCRIHVVANPYEVIESVTQLHIYYPPTWVEVSPLPRGVEYIVDTTLECQADANPPPEYVWTNTKTNERVHGSRLLLNSSFLGEGQSRWECTATNVIHGMQWNVSAVIAFRTVAVQEIVLPGPRLVRAGTYATVSANVEMMELDLLAIENNGKVVVALGGPYNGTSRAHYRQDKYVLTKDGQSSTLVIRDTALNDSGSYRWYVFGTAAVARDNVIVTEQPEVLLPASLVAGQIENLTCSARFGIGTRPAIQVNEYPQVSGLLAGRPLLPLSTSVRKMANSTVLLTKVFRETVLSDWHEQPFMCRLTLPNAPDEHVDTSVTLSVTEDDSPLNDLQL